MMGVVRLTAEKVDFQASSGVICVGVKRMALLYFNE